MTKAPRCARRVQWCMGHRLVDHEGKCQHPHGHAYVAMVEAEADGLDSVGRVVDFSVLKERVGGWIEDNWDHGFLLRRDDVAMLHALRAFSAFQDWEAKHFLLPSNPTAENIADYLLRVVGPDVMEGTRVRIVRVTVWETENCYAVAELEEVGR